VEGLYPWRGKNGKKFLLFEQNLQKILTGNRKTTEKQFKLAKTVFNFTLVPEAAVEHDDNVVQSQANHILGPIL